MKHLMYPKEFASEQRRSTTALLVTVFMVFFVTWSLPAAVSHAATTTIQAFPVQIPDDELPRGNVGDAPPGFGPDSWQGPFFRNSNWFARYLLDGDYLSALFPADAATLTIADLASISYFTKRTVSTPAGQDWAVEIYTRPTGSGDAASWYHTKFINNFDDHTETGAWTQYTTDGAMTFNEETPPSSVEMTLADLIASSGSQEIELIAVRTPNGVNGFDGDIDGLAIVLTNGETGRVDFALDSTTIQVAEWEVPDQERPRVNVGNAPPGFGPDSWQGPLVGKTNWFARYLNGFDFLSDLFPAEAATLTIADLAAIRYFTERPMGTPAGRDWSVQIYTRPTGSGDAASSYHMRFINDFDTHAETGAWTQYSTNSGMTFNEETSPGGEMTLLDLIASNGSQEIEMISVETDSAWNGFDGYIDGLEITLTNGKTGRVNFGGDCDVPSTLTFYVDQATGTDGVAGSNPCLDPAVPCATIQHPIDLACPTGATINVAAGSYDEQVVVVGKDIAIVGAGAGSTIVEPSSVLANTSSFSTGNPIAAIVLVEDSSATTLTGMTVDGASAAFGSCLPGYTGIFYRNASGMVSAMHVTDIFHPTAAVCQSVGGILVESGTGKFSVVSTDGNTVDVYGKYGIACNELGSDCAISNNTVVGRGPVPLGDVAQNGIQIGSGAVGSIVGNTVSDNIYIPQTSCSSGILVNTDGIDVRSNTLDNNFCDVLAMTSGSTLSGNNIAAARESPFSVIGDGNTIDKNRVNGTALTAEGIYVDGINNAFTCNRITNNGTGIFFDTLSTAGTPNAANKNVIAGNTSAGEDATAVVMLPPVDSVDNYWGCATGANTPGCDTAIGNLDASPSAAIEPVCVTCAGAGGDTDNDDVCDPVDNCPLVANAAQDNADGDSFGDACDTCPVDAGNDIDGDTLCADVDNCPLVANLDQSDVDLDGIGDVCDPDDGPGSMVLSRVRLKAAKVGQAVGRGKVAFRVLVADDHAGNFLPDDLIVNGDVRFEVTAGPFAATLNLGNCARRNSHVIACKNGSVKAQARLLPQGSNIFPNTYKMTVRTKRTVDTDAPIGPVTVRLRQPSSSIDRSDDISPCTAKPGRLICRER